MITQALERKKQDDIAHGEIETHHPGYLGSQDTFYVGTIKGVGRIYQQTFVDTYSKWAAAKLYTTNTPITGADLLNDQALPFFTSQEMGIIRILTDRGTEYCGKLETHDYQLYLGINDIEHTKTRHPQTNGICERFHKTVLHEFYQVAFLGEAPVQSCLNQSHFMRRRACHVYGERNTSSVRHCHDLGAFTALCFTNGTTPFFAGAKVPSIKASRKSSLPRSRKSSASVSNMESKTPSYASAGTTGGRSGMGVPPR